MALKDFKSLTKDTLIYGIGNASDRIIRFVLLPLYAAYLPIASYGIRNLTVPLYEILKIIILLSIDQAVIADYYKAKSAEERRTVVSTGFTFSVITSFLIGGLTFLFAPQLARLMAFDTPDAVAILRLFAIFTALTPPNFIFLSFLRCERRPGAYSIFSIAKSLAKVGLMVIFLVVLKRDLVGVYQVDVVMEEFGQHVPVCTAFGSQYGLFLDQNHVGSLDYQVHAGRGGCRGFWIRGQYLQPGIFPVGIHDKPGMDPLCFFHKG
jgi:O-antigen/teichoic acid export membrane protein